MWTSTYGGDENEEGLSIHQSTDGGYIIAGFTLSFGFGGGYADVYLINIDSDGDTLWTKTYGGTDDDEGHSVLQTSDGGYIIAGGTKSFGAGGWDVYLIKTDSSGNTLWTKTYGGTDDDNSWSVQQTADGGYIIAGHTKSFGAGNNDVFLIKTDSLGDTLWTKTYGGTADDWGWCILQETSDSSYIISGGTESFGAGGGDTYLIKVDVDGNTLWTRTYGGSGDDYGRSVQQTADGGYVIAGYTDSFGAGEYDVYLIRTDADGVLLWTTTYGGTNYDYGCSVQQTTDGGYIIAGWTGYFGSEECDVFLIKTEFEQGINVNSEINYSLSASPNPFMESVTLWYSLQQPSDVRIEIFNISGRMVQSLECSPAADDRFQSAVWDRIDSNGTITPDGVYFARLVSDDFMYSEVVKLILLQ